MSGSISRSTRPILAAISGVALAVLPVVDASASDSNFSTKEYAASQGGSLDDLRAANKQAGTLLPQSSADWGEVEVRSRALPIDIFQLQSPFFGAEPNGPDGSTRFSIWGAWNYRDDYANGSDPDDFATIHLDMPGCYRIVESGTLTYKYDGSPTSSGYLYDGGLVTDAPIFGIRNVASGFTLSADNGFGYVVVEQPSGCDGSVGAMFSYEHNQDGGSVVGVSASWGGLNVSYQGGPQTLQKSTNPVYFN